MLVELMMAHQPALNVEVLKQDAARAGVLAEYQVGLLQDADGTKGHILQIADGGGYKV